ncbi:phosphopantothenoylcysteine decarboxylase [uncultured Methanobrevibacter sp.]|uniref:phosphopantothenoylcysteine decarboxylase n=1 Tax=uncultured Methanobrevibacter sp. TaxID=253161 RepID=UPI0025F42879|nr:phosphopantothenoylcysteine decarboxylase [uncultured Methanobrevibacter sp.]
MGGTYEPIDSVRGITNKSSGKMGLELAKEAYIRGANLTLVVANVTVEIPSVFNVINVETGVEMNNAILSLVPDNDIFISAAAVSDFQFRKKSDKKIDSSKSLYLDLKPTTKIIRQIKKINPDIFLVGFKAEFNISHEQMVKCARKQISDAGTDLVVANDISKQGCQFGSDNNEVLLVDDNVLSVPYASKKQIAKIIFDEISKRL